MFNFDYITKDTKKHNSHWLQIPCHLYRVLIVGESGSGKKKLFNLMRHQPDTDKNLFIY